MAGSSDGEPSARLAGRNVVGSLKLPSYGVQKAGRVVVKIAVDREGNVTEAIPGVEGTSVTDRSLWNAAKGIGSTALNAVKSFLGIASPSTEAAKLGRFTAEGFALGLEKETRNAVKSASNLAAEAQNELSNINLQNAFSSLSALKNSRLSDVVTRTINNSTTTTNAPVINVRVSGVTINNDSDIDALTDRIANQLGEKMIQDGRRWG